MLKLRQCRACLSEPGIHDIFQENRPGTALRHMFSVINVQMQEGDGHPPAICSQCLCSLRHAHDFKVKCYASQTALSIGAGNRQIKKETANGHEEIVFVTKNVPSGSILTEEHIKPESVNAISSSQTEIKIKEDIQMLETNENSDSSDTTKGYSDECETQINKKYKCTLCSKEFRHKFNLKNHYKETHKGEAQHECVHCNKHFKFICHLKTHLLKHSGIKPHKCTHCNKLFNDYSNFKRHLKVHSGVKSLKCTECDKTFAQTSHLNRHLLAHSRVKLYKCPQCDKCFSLSSELKRHSLIHNGIKKHKCSECDKAFNQACTLKRHLVTHNKPRTHKCSLCKKTFSLIQQLRQHVLTH